MISSLYYVASSASSYGAGNYNTNIYNGSNTAANTTTTTTTSTGTSNGLQNTGAGIWAPIGFSCLLIIAALLLLKPSRLFHKAK
ncbi:MAG: hypothetical protein JWN38_588 [Candidatus Saccharibacteria bacterium]|nr:hypothetical protein [Candidatus Saccharibacteria bacterium]